MTPFTSPSFKLTSFNCPHCSAFAQQDWYYVYRSNAFSSTLDVHQLLIAECNHCHELTYWLDEKLLYPDVSGIPPANPDLDADIIVDYNEARSILHKSPRGATALLRLAIQKLCIQLGEKGKKIDDDVASLVKKGLSVTIQQALDYVRVVGNNAVHPGTIDLNDNPEIANKLFEIINIIARTMITEPKVLAELFESLPEAQKAAIKKRDSSK